MKELEMMCNEKAQETHEEYRFLEYRIDQLEKNITQSIQKNEEQQKNNYTEIMKMLQVMQEGNNKQNEQLISLNQRLNGVEEKLKCIEKLKEVATKNSTRITELERRIDVYKQVLFVIGTGVAVALIVEFVKFI